ncbi:hypothetical protein STEG23_023028, partial [Scotinomys teguina]
FIYGPPNRAVAMELSANYFRKKLRRDLEAEHVEVEDRTLNVVQPASSPGGVR